MTQRELSIVLDPETSAVGTARRFVVEAMDSLEVDGVVEEARVMVSELVANALDAGSAVIGVRVWSPGPHRLRVEVTDTASGVPAVRRRQPLASDGGRGLLIVEALATRWGHEPVGDGKTVWFELEGSNHTRPSPSSDGGPLSPH